MPEVSVCSGGSQGVGPDRWHRHHLRTRVPSQSYRLRSCGEQRSGCCFCIYSSVGDSDTRLSLRATSPARWFPTSGVAHFKIPVRRWPYPQTWIRPFWGAVVGIIFPARVPGWSSRGTRGDHGCRWLKRSGRPLPGLPLVPLG